MKIATIDTTKATVLIGEGILRKMLKTSTKDAKAATKRTTVIMGSGLELTGISKVGFLARLPQIDKVWGTPAKERRRLTMAACQTQKLNT